MALTPMAAPDGRDLTPMADGRWLPVSTALGLTVLQFAVLGSVLFAGASQQLIGGVLGFSAAALLYLVTEELLIEAHAVEEKPVSTLVLLADRLARTSITQLNAPAPLKQW